MVCGEGDDGENEEGATEKRPRRKKFGIVSDSHDSQFYIQNDTVQNVLTKKSGNKRAKKQLALVH